MKDGTPSGLKAKDIRLEDSSEKTLNKVTEKSLTLIRYRDLNRGTQLQFLESTFEKNEPNIFHKASSLSFF